jgi:riboflavin kinase/FMN adenylyltransferase
MKKASAMLGRYFSLEGRVVSGAGRGTELGFPTANLDIDPGQALPADGSYASLAHTNGEPHPSVTFIGCRPTFGERERQVEVHILDFEGELYRRSLRVDIIERLRDEQRFEDAETLKKQIAQDVARARERLANIR